MGDAATKAVSALRTLMEERSGGEHRPQQEALAASVAEALETGSDLLVQAGTGTGKSLGYLVPIALSGKRVVVSTATKQLGDQLARTDLPTVAHLLPRAAGVGPSYAIVKGRRSYVCRARISELKPAATATADRTPGPVPDELALFDAPSASPVTRRHLTGPVGPEVATPLDRLIAWAESSSTGDRTDAPAGTTEAMWREVSVDSAGCPGAHRCAFGPTCFSEAARRDARTADIVITNHALVAQDLRSSTPIFGDWDVLVLDEGHEVEGVLTEAWAAQVRPTALHAAVGLAARRFPRTPEEQPPPTDGLLHDLDALVVEMQQLPPGELQALPPMLRALLEAIAMKLAALSTELEAATRGPTDDESTNAGASAQLLHEARDAIATVLTDDSGRARWLERGRADTGPGELRSAPLWVGPELRRLRGDRTLIATSATLTVSGSFAPFARALGLREDWTGLDVGTPFDYRRQAALYIPHPGRFPAPVGRDRAEHTAAVLVELTSLVRAAGGRTLALFTTTNGARQAAEHLRHAVTTPVLSQGEAPVGQLIARFAEDEATTLCATMGLWHGVDVPGPSLTCLVLDKIPFAPLDAPVASARRRSADEAGRDGFAEVYVADAAVKITQGVGRLIRTTTDRGVVAVLDPRLLTKGYGRTILGSLPTLHRTSDLEAVIAMIGRIV